MTKASFFAAIATPFVFAGILTSAQAADGNGATTDVKARYKLSFNGLDVGSYDFESQFDGKSYVSNSSAKVSAVFGAFKWRGDIQSNGKFIANKPRPANYEMNFKTKKKGGSVKLGFDSSGVSSVALEPNKPPRKDAVPIAADHLKNVFDPMSAIMAMSHAVGPNPCKQRIPIFDGKARFDLVMSPKGTEKISDKSPSGQPRELIVCRVKYQPISGHKPKDFVDPWVDYNNLEIAFRPIPSADIFVPYRITIPTTLGPCMMAAENVTITSPNHPQIALRQ